jgi:cytochrome c2
MSYAGVKNDQTRADVIAWLNKNSDSPVKLPGTK